MPGGFGFRTRIGKCAEELDELLPAAELAVAFAVEQARVGGAEEA